MEESPTTESGPPDDEGEPQEMRTPQGRALLHLLDDLATLRSRAPALTAPELAQAFADRVVMTPCIWPLDEFLYAMVLETACFDLSDAESLSAAASLTALLLGTGHIAIHWSCDSGCSPLQEHVLSDDEARQAGADGAADGWFDEELEVRGFLERRYADDMPPNSQAA